MFEHGQKVAARSFELGTIRILKGKTNAESWTQFTTWIQTNVQLEEAHTVFGTGGNVNRALKIIAPKQQESLTLASLTDLHDKLIDLTLEERCDQYQLKPDRADVLVPALKIYITALNALGQNTLVVPKIGLSDGVIYQLYLQNTNF